VELLCARQDPVRETSGTACTVAVLAAASR